MKKATSATMQPSKLNIIVAFAIFLQFSLLLSTVDGQHYFCDDQDGNFTSNETYGTTIDALLSSITTTSSSTLTYGLFNVSASRPQYPDDIQVLGVCTGDLTSVACRDCLNMAADRVRQLCPTKKLATLFEDKCWIRYSNVQLYGVLKTYPSMVIWNVQNASNGDLFMEELKKLLDSLRGEAASGGPIRKYAAGNTSVDLYTLYAMVQCSPDLNDQQCSDCLVSMTGSLPQGKVGGLVLSPSCQTGFATYRYFNSVVVPLPSPPPPLPTTMIVPPLPPSQTGNRFSKTGIIVGASSGSALIVICILVFLCWSLD